METPAAAPPKESPAIEIMAEAQALAEAVPSPIYYVNQPEAPGILTQSCDTAIVDYSNHADGYIMVKYTGETDSRLKLILQGPQTEYKYNLPENEWAVFPLSEGSGSYQASVYENLYDTKYALVMAAEFEAQLNDEFAPFLRPNQYVNYSEATRAVQLAAELLADIPEALDKISAVYDYVVTNLSYDYDKAQSVKSGYLPMLDEVLESKKGICFDYAALMTAMLRSQQIPCKLVVGYAGSVYHAWISVWTEADGWIDAAIFFDGHSWKRLDPTFASSANGDEAVIDFILNGQYQAKYQY